MIEHIDAHYVAAQVRLVRQVHKGSILLLEGPTDSRIFERFIDRQRCDIEVGFGKKNVIGALDILEDDGLPGVLAVVDADFDRVLGVTYKLENLCVTHLHDFDLTIFASPALETFLREYARDDLFAKVFKSNVEALRAKIVETALPLARCRLISEYRNLNFYFVDLRHAEFVSAHDLSVAVDALYQAIIDRSRTGCTLSQLKAFVTGEITQFSDQYQIVNGHDVAAMLGIALRGLIATRSSPQTWASEIESGLRMAFDWEAMQRTGVYECIRHWEADNQPYRVFRN
jgi:hypothetical protein